MSGNAGLKGKTVLVTGGSRGIGRATDETKHRDGAHVILHYSSAAGDAQAVQEQLGDRIQLVQGNLAEPGQAQEIWAAAGAWNGRVDVLVNNAGAWLDSLLDEPETWAEGWKQNLQLNLQSPADLCREAILHYKRHGGGIIVNVASISRTIRNGSAASRSGRSRRLRTSPKSLRSWRRESPGTPRAPPSTSPAPTTCADHHRRPLTERNAAAVAGTPRSAHPLQRARFPFRAPRSARSRRCCGMSCLEVPLSGCLWAAVPS
jgi:NAD(P)-dependent dehydrogenase (short-subunit alcohol dehydrogenase family)